jgi:hypothetical protein
MLNQNNQYTSDPNSPYMPGYQSSGGAGTLPRRRRYGCNPVGCVVLLVVAVLVVGGGFFLTHLPNYTPPAFLEQLPGLPLIIGAVATFLVLALLQRLFRYSPLGRLIRGLLGFLIVVVMAGVFGWVFLVNPYVGMTKTGFLRPSVSVTNGGTLHFQNPRDGVTQTLCIGVDQKCQSEDGAPDVLQHGIRVQPGQTVDISFQNDGNYHITSQNTPGMNMSVEVSTNDDSGD